MKLISYYQVNSFLRRQRIAEKEDALAACDKNNNKPPVDEKKVISENLATDTVKVVYPNNLNHKGIRLNFFLF